MSERLSENFFRSEFACKCGCGFDTVDSTLVQGLQRLRDIVQAPIRVNSGCRCENHNADIGGEPKSQHLLGKAADIVAEGYSPEDIADFAKILSEFANSGIGLYDRFTHLDVRDGKARWDNRKQK